MTQFAQAIALIDQTNAADPDGYELSYSQRMTHWLDRLAPSASQTLHLAGRLLHVRRWDISRQSFPMDRDGYLAYRKRLADHHAQVAGALLQQTGYDASTIEQVQALLYRKNLKSDPQAQVLEDAACLIFFEQELEPLLARPEYKDYPQSKWLNILRRTWVKMSPQGQELVLTLPLSPSIRSLVQQVIDEITQRKNAR